jgi:hypothetical protein
MPTANIYVADAQLKSQCGAIATQLRELLARELTCGERTLTPEEISVRLLTVEGSTTIAPIEMEIIAHAYGERVPRADKICVLVRKFLLQKIPAAKDVQVWLILAELAHSWEN